MSTIVGGLRIRFIRESLYHMLYDALEELGWFNSGRMHLPIHFTGDAVPHDVEMPFNTISLSDEDMGETDLELGSTAVEIRWTFYLDFYGENDSVAKHIINDIRDILGGRMSSIGRGDPSFMVYDYRLATPAELFRVQIEDIGIDRAHDFPKPWQKHWYSARFDLVDYYRDDDEVFTPPSGGGGGGYGGY